MFQGMGMNNCYECGVEIPTFVHFCDRSCRKKYMERYGRDKFMRVLGRQTKMRKRLGLPRYTKEDDE